MTKKVIIDDQFLILSGNISIFIITKRNNHIFILLLKEYMYLRILVDT